LHVRGADHQPRAALRIADAHAQGPRLPRETPILQGIAVAARRAQAWVPGILAAQHLDL
jgi:hypothetical protein